MFKHPLQLIGPVGEIQVDFVEPGPGEIILATGSADVTAGGFVGGVQVGYPPADNAIMAANTATPCRRALKSGRNGWSGSRASGDRHRLWLDTGHGGCRCHDKQFISVGVAQWQQGNVAVNTWLKETDIALYHAKSLGRNRVYPSSRLTVARSSAG
ncbi:MAG: hypothetical protein JWQ89_4476 [Devosia sp.]|nr:hypothetical protein [Devosia sp.]